MHVGCGQDGQVQLSRGTIRLMVIKRTWELWPEGHRRNLGALVGALLGLHLGWLLSELLGGLLCGLLCGVVGGGLGDYAELGKKRTRGTEY